MVEFTPIAQLEQAKTGSGSMTFLDYRAFDLVTAHRALGREVRQQVWKILTKKLDTLSDGRLVEHLRVVRRCKAAIKEKLEAAGMNNVIRQTLIEYGSCLSAWGEGVELDRFHHGRLRQFSVDGEPVAPDELALLLQDDNSGCQTGVYRDRDAGVILWHTEEDPSAWGERFDRLRIASFQTGQGDTVEALSAFIYPDLLPGPAYCWRGNNFAQAVDTLHPEPNPRVNGMLANIATWITWRLGPAVESNDVIRALQPFHDGYAVTVVQRQGSSIRARKIEFAAGWSQTEELNHEPHRFLFQVNLISNKHTPVVETVRPGMRTLFEARLVRTNRALTWLKASPDACYGIFRLMAFRLGGDFSYANSDVKSYFLNKVSEQGMEIWLDVGPALKRDQPMVIKN
jgi:hypothetical protein